jgi:diguanylate cyclase (GGDEF)-like protein/PAS domain S-box-containing protein
MSALATLVAAGVASAAALMFARLAFEARRLRMLLDAAPESIFAVDAAGRIRYANARAAAQFRYTRRELLDRVVEALVPEPAREAHVRVRHAYAAAPHPRPMGGGVDVEGLRSDGTTFPASISLNHVRIGHRTQILCVVRDITAQHALDRSMREANAQLTRGLAELERRAADLKELTEMGELLQCCVSEAELERVVAAAIARIVPGSGGALYLGERGQPALHSGQGWGSLPGAVPTSFDRSACWALRRGRLHRVGAGSATSRCDHAPCDARLHHVCVPMLAHGESLGVLAICTEDDALARELADGPKRQIVQALATQTALGLGNLRLREQLESESIRDALTGLYNRRHFERCAEAELRRAVRSGRVPSLLAIDMDRFKAINDRHGHPAGDQVLRGIAQVMSRALRATDVVCRVGGEEFFVLLPETDEHSALVVAEALRAAIASDAYVVPDGARVEVTVSIGVAESASVAPDRCRDLVERADRALYAAKAGGRNAVVPASSPAAADHAAEHPATGARRRCPTLSSLLAPAADATLAGSDTGQPVHTPS